MDLDRKTKDAKRMCAKQKLENGKHSQTESNLMTCGLSTTRKRWLPVDEDLTCGPSITKEDDSLWMDFSMTCSPSNTNNFEVIPIIGDGNCLFRAISYCLYGTEDRHPEQKFWTNPDRGLISMPWRLIRSPSGSPC